MSGRACIACALALFFCAGSLTAQSEAVSRKLGSASLERLLRAKQEELARREAEIERHVNGLVRHHLGIVVDDEKNFTLTAEERVAARAELEKEVEASMDAVSHWNRELEGLRVQLGHAHTAVAEDAEEQSDDRTWATRERPGNPSAVTLVEPRPSPRPPIRRDPVAETAPPAAPAASAPPQLILGTIDHDHLGRAFFQAGMYDKALHQLERYADDEEAPLVALFYLARCYERLGDVARADGTFLRIEALDEKRGANGTWASAARTARQHMNWMSDHGEWRPPLTPAEQGQ